MHTSAKGKGGPPMSLPGLYFCPQPQNGPLHELSCFDDDAESTGLFGKPKPRFSQPTRPKENAEQLKKRSTDDPTSDTDLNKVLNFVWMNESNDSRKKIVEYVEALGNADLVKLISQINSNKDKLKSKPVKILVNALIHERNKGILLYKAILDLQTLTDNNKKNGAKYDQKLDQIAELRMKVKEHQLHIKTLSADASKMDSNPNNLIAQRKMKNDIARANAAKKRAKDKHEKSNERYNSTKNSLLGNNLSAIIVQQLELRHNNALSDEDTDQPTEPKNPDGTWEDGTQVLENFQYGTSLWQKVQLPGGRELFYNTTTQQWGNETDPRKSNPS